jgi:hypothetical protein
MIDIRSGLLRIIRTLCLVALLGSLVATVNIGCEKEGPAEKAGKKLDEVMDSVKKAVDN